MEEKTKIIKTRVTQAEYEKVKKKALENNISISEHLRHNLLSSQPINPLYSSSVHDYLVCIRRCRDLLASQNNPHVDPQELRQSMVSILDKELVMLWRILNSSQTNI